MHARERETRGTFDAREAWKLKTYIRPSLCVAYFVRSFFSHRNHFFLSSKEEKSSIRGRTAMLALPPNSGTIVVVWSCRLKRFSKS